MPRPKKDERRKQYKVRLLEAELATIQQNAKDAGLTVSEYLRRAALGRRIRSKVKTQMLGEVSRLGGLQKHLLTQIKGHPYEGELRNKLNGLLAEIHSTLRALSQVDRGENV